MNAKIQIALVITLLFMALANSLLIAAFLLNSDKVEVLHDQLLVSESKLETRNDDYNRLLEKVGGADIPKVVPFVTPRPGKLGDK
jgi:hypothetical protein